MGGWEGIKMLTMPNGIQSQTVLDYGAIKKGAQLSSGETHLPRVIRLVAVLLVSHQDAH